MNSNVGGRASYARVSTKDMALMPTTKDGVAASANWLMGNHMRGRYGSSPAQRSSSHKFRQKDSADANVG